MTGIVLLVAAVVCRTTLGFTTMSTASGGSSTSPICHGVECSSTWLICPDGSTPVTTPGECCQACPTQRRPIVPFGQPPASQASPFGQPPVSQASPFDQPPAFTASPFDKPPASQASPFDQPLASQASPFDQPPASQATPFGPDCSQFQCSVPTCPDGSMPTAKAGECCPACSQSPGAGGIGAVTSGPQNCSQTQCMAPSTCPDGATPTIQSGECCPTCQQIPIGVPPVLGPEVSTSTGSPAANCQLNQCKWPSCPAGSSLITPTGECCPECVPQTGEAGTVV